jgi:nondiscriminating aspartyl-tRNA synthetase
MERTLIGEISKRKGEKVLVKGRVLNTRSLSNVVFLVVQDHTGTIQAVLDKESPAKNGEAVAIEALVKEEPRAKGGYELQAEKVGVISCLVAELPFDMSKNDLNLNLDTLLDNRAIALRHPKIQAIFRLYDILLKAYEMSMREEGFAEIKTPKLLGSATEGGANFFKVKYFEKEATLAQSPQFYKQMMVGVFEKVFEIGSVFRAEPHFTTRHVNEYIGLDGEMGFIEDFRDVTTTLGRIMKKMFALLAAEGQQYLDLYGVKLTPVPDEIPHFKLADIKDMIKKEYGHDVPAGTDIDPRGELLAGKYAKEKLGSDFVFLTHYPWTDRPFYTMPDPEDPTLTLSFDLLYNGMEIASGSQRIHSYDQLMENMQKKRVNPVGMEPYLEVFKFAMPPHGGWGLGSERIIQQILGLGSIKEAVLFPRDVKRLAP